MLISFHTSMVISSSCVPVEVKRIAQRLKEGTSSLITAFKIYIIILLILIEDFTDVRHLFCIILRCQLININLHFHLTILYKIISIKFICSRTYDYYNKICEKKIVIFGLSKCLEGLIYLLLTVTKYEVLTVFFNT